MRLGRMDRLGMAMIACFAFLGGHAWATDILFKNGQQMRGVNIVTRNEEFVSVQIESGVIRYPISALKSIDGVPIETLPPKSSLPPAEDDAQPVATPQPSATAAATVPSAQPQPAPVTGLAPDRWNFELFLFGFLIVSGLWMRGLHAVESDLFERRVEPRIWMMAALLVPVFGAAAYFATRLAQEKFSETARTKARKAADETSAGVPVSGTGMPFPPNVPKFDPAQHIAKHGKVRKGLTFLDTNRQSIALKGNGEEASGLDNANEMLEEALLEGASDVHIEPASDCYRVRFRLDGILHERMSYSSTDGVRLVTALKSLSEIDVSEKRKAQDGKFRVKCDGREVDFRVATANSIYGEKMVIRVLDHRGGIFDLTSLGMSPEMLATFQHVINSRNGMILATGPTGSGKTSTLYAALRQLDGSSLNIMTIEDPVEYELSTATQLAVNPRAGITYEGGLRSILRQDPDVILVGEMRDAEATGIALRAALTGHLVFSTLHTKDAIGTVSRLQDMGIERYQVASALLMVLAQRLVRMLCSDCRRPYAAEGPELESVGISFEPGATIYAPEGCDACHGTGFKGRTGIFELLVLDDEFRRAFSDGMDEAALTAFSMERGFRNYRYDGAEKVLLGITTVEEVLRAS